MKYAVFFSYFPEDRGGKKLEKGGRKGKKKTTRHMRLGLGRGRKMGRGGKGKGRGKKETGPECSPTSSFLQIL